MITSFAIIVAGLAIGTLGHADHENQTPMSGPHKGLWYNTLPGDGGTQVCHIFLILERWLPPDLFAGKKFFFSLWTKDCQSSWSCELLVGSEGRSFSEVSVVAITS